MKTKFLFIMIFTCVEFGEISAQTNDEDALKQTARMESEAYAKKDTAAWKALFVQDEKTLRINIGNGFYNIATGWQNFAPYYIQYMKSNPEPMKYSNLVDSNYVIRMSNNLATVDYDQSWILGNEDSPTVSHESRTMVKVNNEWKITSLVTMSTSSYISGDSSTIENNLNGTGYQLLGAKKYNDAIDVFKLNVKLFPKSWNVYDSLGEAYADNGNTSDAIKNYAMSLQLNPSNDNGKQMLEKLKKK